MTERIKAFFVSKRTQAISLSLGLLSLILALLCFIAPLGREQWAVQSLGEASVNQISSVAMSMTHYEPQRLRYLLATESTGPTYNNLVELLAQAKKEYGFSRMYLVYRDGDGIISTLADADYVEGDAGPGQLYLQGYYDTGSLKMLDNILRGKNSEGYLEEIYNGNLVLAFAPLIDPDSGEVMAVLCADAPLSYTNFSQFYGVELAQIAEVLAATFIVCFVVFFIGRSFVGEEDSKNGKNDKNNGRWHSKPTVTQQQTNLYVDPLDDVDPNDYL